MTSARLPLPLVLPINRRKFVKHGVLTPRIYLKFQKRVDISMTVNAHITRKPDYVFLAFLGLAMLFWGLAIYGGVINYSPVPFWDMWPDSTHNFTLMHQGHWGILWSQHNEHRIVLSRLLFWVDQSLFGGKLIFLFIVNYILLAFIMLIFWQAFQENCARYGKDYRFIGLFLLIWLSSWMQWENLTWAYQSQFWLAQLLPLSAFLMLRKAAIHQAQRSSRYFFAACLLGILSLGSMANGMLALPLITGYALLMRLGHRRILILGLLSLLGLLAYLHHYHSINHGFVNGHNVTIATTIGEIRNDPVTPFKYILIYFGSPWFAMFSSMQIAMLAGCLFMVASIYLVFESLKNTQRHTLNLALGTFVTYIGASGLGTALGRIPLGIDQALSSRYTTPILMAWAALLVMLAPKLIRGAANHRQKLYMPLLTLTVFMLTVQLKAWDSPVEKLFQRKIAALALDMGITDPVQTNRIYPDSKALASYAKEGSRLKISIFGLPLYRNVSEHLGQHLTDLELRRIAHIKSHCIASADGVRILKNDNRYVGIDGWVFNPATRQVPRALWIVDKHHVVVGYVLAGRPRPDVARLVAPYAGQSGFEGYVFKSMQGQVATLVDRDDQCATTVTLGTAHKSP